MRESTTSKLNKASYTIIEKLQNRLRKDLPSEDLDSFLKDIESMVDLLPTGPRNFSDLASMHTSNLVIFAKKQYPMVMHKILSNFNHKILHETFKLLTITDNPYFIIESLNVITNDQILNDNVFMIQLFEKIIRDTDNYLVFSFIRLSQYANKYSEDLLIEIEQYIQKLTSLPTIIANRLKQNFPDAFKEDSYAAIIMLNALKAHHIIVQINESENKLIYDFEFLARLISKVVTTFRASQSVKWTIKILASQAEHKRYQESIQQIMKFLQRNAIEVVAIESFRNELKKIRLVKMFGKMWKSSTEWKFVLLKKMPFFNSSNSDLLISNLVYFLEHEDSKLMNELLIEMLMIWNTKTHLVTTSFEQHFNITKLIVLMIAYSSSIKEKTEEVRKMLFTGLEIHLESSDDKLRALGMITAETIIDIIDIGDNSVSLKFSYDSFNEKIKTELINVIKEFSARKLHTADNLCQNDNEEIEDSILKLVSLSENKTIVSNDIQVKKEIVKKESTFRYELDSDDDDSELHLENSQDKRFNKNPLNVLDLIRAFSIKEEIENRERFEAAIESTHSIIIQQLPYHDPDIAIDLLRVLIDLQMHSYIENFEKIKRKALLEVCSIHPKECARYICQEFNAELIKYPLKTRLFMLDILEETAKRLSKLEMRRKQENLPDSQSLSDTKITLKLQEELVNHTKRDAQKIIRERLIIRTNRREKQDKFGGSICGVNQFSSIAGYFFFPLLKGFGQQQMLFTKDNLKNDVNNTLLLKFLHTISVLMICAENAPIATKMAREIVNISIFLRYHEESQIRLAVLHMFATIFLAVPKNVLVKEFIVELEEFISYLKFIEESSIVNFEPDVDCREFSRQLISMCYRALSFDEIHL